MLAAESKTDMNTHTQLGARWNQLLKKFAESPTTQAWGNAYNQLFQDCIHSSWNEMLDALIDIENERQRDTFWTASLQHSVDRALLRYPMKQLDPSVYKQSPSLSGFLLMINEKQCASS